MCIFVDYVHTWRTWHSRGQRFDHAWWGGILHSSLIQDNPRWPKHSIARFCLPACHIQNTQNLICTNIHTNAEAKNQTTNKIDDCLFQVRHIPITRGCQISKPENAEDSKTKSLQLKPGFCNVRPPIRGPSFYGNGSQQTPIPTPFWYIGLPCFCVI